MWPDLPDHLDNPDSVARVLSRSQALELGFTRHAIAHRVTSQRWHLVLPHTYLTGSTLTWRDRLEAALIFAGPDSLLTGAAALADLGLRSVSRPTSPLLLVPSTCRVRPAGWVRIRRTKRMPPRALVPGPRRAELSRAVADLALERRRLDDVRALVAQAIRAELCTVEELIAELASGPTRHSAHLRCAIADVSNGAWSAPEAMAAGILRRADVPPFELNKRIDLPNGSFAIADVLWRQLRAVLEIDSDEYHYNDPADRDHTARRASLLQTVGFSVISRRPAAIARAPRQFRSDVEAWLAARGAELSARRGT